MKLFKRVSVGFHNYHFVEINDEYTNHVDTFIEKHGVDDNEFFETIYDYNEKQQEYGVNNKSVSGLTGLTTSRIVFDFDSATDVAASQKEAVSLVNTLLVNGISEDAIRSYFSGFKGFHVEVRFTERLTKKEVDNIVRNLTEDFETIDYKILDENRLIRLPLTKNIKTGMYKIPLTRTELQELSLHTIYSKAKNVSQEDYDSYVAYIGSIKPTDIPTSVNQLRNLTVNEKHELDENEKFQDAPDRSKFIDILTPAKNALLQGFFDKGERNAACMILASTFRHLRFDKETTYNILKDTLRKRARRLGEENYDKEELWKTIIEPVYAPSWKGGTFSEDQNDLLKKTIERFELQTAKDNSLFKSPDDMINSAVSFLKNFESNRVKTGIKILDEHVFLTKGMLVGILGGPSVGKTSFLNNFVEHTSLTGNTCLYFSMDMSEDLLAIRMLGKYSNKSLKELEEIIVNNENDPIIENARKTFNERFINAKFNFRTGPSIEDIDYMITQAKASYGENLTMIALDYMEKIKGPYTDATANSAYIASRLSDMAKNHNVCIVLLLQPQKSAGDPSAPLLSMRKIKGASTIEQDCRVVLTIWRPGFDPEYANDPEQNLDHYTTFAVVKQNMAGLGKFDFIFDPKTGNVKEMNEQEKLQFEENMRIIEQRKAERQQVGNAGNSDLF